MRIERIHLRTIYVKVAEDNWQKTPMLTNQRAQNFPDFQSPMQKYPYNLAAIRTSHGGKKPTNRRS